MSFRDLRLLCTRSYVLLPFLVLDNYRVRHCAHALALFYVAAEEAGSKAAATSEKGLVSPGTLRQFFLDALHYLEETEVRRKVNIHMHTEGLKNK